jgi:uncharacterized protein DUF3302
LAGLSRDLSTTRAPGSPRKSARIAFASLSRFAKTQALRLITIELPANARQRAQRHVRLPRRPVNFRPAIPVESRPLRATARIAAATLACAASAAARASFLSGEALDTAANVLSWVVLLLVPIVAIAVFWMVHVLPEKIAHKRHHPQRQAIQTLCLLSLVFGGLLWPIAWLWAYTRPVGHKLAYGTDKHEDYFEELGEKARSGQLVDAEIANLRSELDAMQARGALSPRLGRLRDEIVAAQAGVAAPKRQPVEAVAGGSR